MIEISTKPLLLFYQFWVFVFTKSLDNQICLFELLEWLKIGILGKNRSNSYNLSLFYHLIFLESYYILLNSYTSLWHLFGNVCFSIGYKYNFRECYTKTFQFLAQLFWFVIFTYHLSVHLASPLYWNSLI